MVTGSSPDEVEWGVNDPNVVGVVDVCRPVGNGGPPPMDDSPSRSVIQSCGASSGFQNLSLSKKVISCFAQWDYKYLISIPF